MVEIEEVQTSFAPIRTVAYWMCCEAAVVSWPSSADIWAPVLASLKAWPLIFELRARIRRYWLFTDALVPVDHE